MTTTKADQLSAYFRRLWRDTDGVVYFMAIDHKNTRGRRFFSWPQEADSIPEFVFTAVAQGYEVYCSPALFKAEAKEAKSAQQDMVLGSWVAWADFDGNAPQSWAADDADRPSKVIPEPTWRIRSSTEDRQHCYWLFEEFETDPDKIGLRNRAIAVECGADRGGWDPGQLLRPPYTTNFGYGKEERKGATYPVVIEAEALGNRYGEVDFEFVNDFIPTTLVGVEWDSLPGVGQVLARGTFGKDFTDLFFKAQHQLLPDPKTGKVDRSKALLNVAFQAAEAGLTDPEIIALVLDADDRWGKYKLRTDRISRISEMVERVREKHPFGTASLTFDGLLLDASKTVYNLAEFMSQEWEVDWIMQGVVPKGSFGFIAGPPGVGKTTFGIRLAEAMAAGDDFLGIANEAGPLKVLFLSMEMSAPTLHHFMQTMAPFSPNLAAERLLVFPTEPVNLSTQEGRTWLETTLDKHQPDVVFIDSLGKVAGAELTKDDAVRELMIYLYKTRVSRGITLYMIHHSRKASERNKHPDTLDDLYGSQYLAAEPDWVLMLTKENEEQGQLRATFTKVRLGPYQPPRIITRDDHLNFTIDDAGRDGGNMNPMKGW